MVHPTQKPSLSLSQIVLVLSTSLLLLLAECAGDVYINHFAVHIEGGHHVADRVAREAGFKNLGQIGSLDHRYLFEAPNRERRSASPSHHHHSALKGHDQVIWFEQQIAKTRSKRDFQPREVAQQMSVTDPLWSDEWYLHGGAYGDFDMNVLPAWKKGYTGKNIVVTILDDGLERDHPDLMKSYDRYASYDVNSHDSDPMPRYDPSNENRHGTRCAGEVSAEANNTFCSIGIAPDARIGGIRMLDGEVYDAVEAASLSFNRSHIDIYSASWGPDDDGKVVDGPGKMAKKAFIDGIHDGRGGKGSIFVWASGNGGSARDSCNCDGYANSIFTLSISSTSENGRKPWYLEECSSTLATTYSSGSNSERKIATTDIRKRCTTGHTGTSASAPLAAGIVALVLEANKDLTWRDVQYITLMAARPEPMVDGEWVVNGVGRKVSLRYGYGLMDASAMVDLALKWTNVPPKVECLAMSDVHNAVLVGHQRFTTEIETNGCNGSSTKVVYLEHVQARISLNYVRRGDVIIYLVSPSGTRSKLLPQRQNDRMQGGFDQWPFLSVHFWGENPKGKWRLDIEDGDTYNQRLGGGTLLSWSLVFHGTKTNPVNLRGRASPKYTQKATVAVTETSTAGFNKTKLPTSPELCHKQCVEGCTGVTAHDCIKCKNFRMMDTHECVEECPAGFFSKEEGSCLKCDPSCATCSGPTLTECLTCKANFEYNDKIHFCTPFECEAGFYMHNTSCEPCHGSCHRCEWMPTKCMSCQHGRILKDHQCVPAGQPHGTVNMVKQTTIVIGAICSVLIVIIFAGVTISYLKDKQLLCWSERTKYGRLPVDDVVRLAFDDDMDENYGPGF